jgi:hypothetical protein
MVLQEQGRRCLALDLSNVDEERSLDGHVAPEQKLRRRTAAFTRWPPISQPHAVRDQRFSAAQCGFAASVAAVDGRHESLHAETRKQGGGVEGEQDLRTIAASETLSDHAVVIRPEEHKAVQEFIPIGRLEAIVERPSEGCRRHRPLITNDNSLRQADAIRPMTAEQSRTL